MAVLKIYNDIQSESDKKLAQMWGDAEGVCFKDVDEFVSSIPKDDDKIEIRLFCDGGSVLEGWAMYDRLRATGKEITTIVEGHAASMATIILMAAPIERRLAYESAEICVHNPWLFCGEPANADDLQRMADDLRREQQRMVDLYVSRCDGKATAEQIQSLMDADKYITAKEALELGLIGGIIKAQSAKKSKHIINKSIEKEVEKVEVKKSLLGRMLEKLGFKSLNEAAEVLAMELNTADGQVLTFEREEGSPQVGDTATPDGEFEMPDGSTIVIENGVVSEIKPKEEEAGEGEEDENGKKGENDDGEAIETEMPAEEVEEENDKVVELETKVAELEERVAELEKMLADAEAKAKTTDDLRILNAVKMAGGEKVLANFTSNYAPTKRKADNAKVAEAAKQRNELREKIDAIRAKRK